MPRVEFGLPSLGHTMDEAVILEWGKEPGDEVAQGEFLVEVETDKVEVQIEVPVNGRLVERVAEVGQTCPVGEVIAVFEID
jgi:pyruvate/2-oxoglutarate dehydrogenase complex dihydrolipoamide acyltransferase (E2) component